MKPKTRDEGPTPVHPGVIAISPETQAKCDATNQFENFDRLFRSVITVPKAAIDKAEKNWKRAKKRRQAK